MSGGVAWRVSCLTLLAAAAKNSHILARSNVDCDVDGVVVLLTRYCAICTIFDQVTDSPHYMRILHSGWLERSGCVAKIHVRVGTPVCRVSCIKLGISMANTTHAVDVHD